MLTILNNSVPKVPTGFGANIPATTTYMPYMKSIGMTNVRLESITPIPWYNGWALVARNAAAAYKAAGFWVQYGCTAAVSQGGFTYPYSAANWHLSRFSGS